VPHRRGAPADRRCLQGDGDGGRLVGRVLFAQRRARWLSNEGRAPRATLREGYSARTGRAVGVDIWDASDQ